MRSAARSTEITALGGNLKHIRLWVTSPVKDQVLANPRFISKVPGEEEEKGSMAVPVAIYCIHGTADRAGGMGAVADKLLNDGLPGNISKVCLPVFDNRGMGSDIEAFAEQLAMKILANGDRDVILMGHSRGGLVAAWFAENLAKELGIRVHLVIPVCTPFGGSNKAIPPGTWFSKSVAEMQKNSLFLTNLNEQVRQSDISYRYFSADNDELVDAADAHVSENDTMTVIPGQTHLSALHTEQLAMEIHGYLDEMHFPDNSLESDIPDWEMPNDGYSLCEELTLRQFENSFENIEPDDLLALLETSIKKWEEANPALYKAGLEVHREAKNTLPSRGNAAESKKWKMSTVLALQVLENPQNLNAVRLLNLNAAKHASGKSSGWRKFAAALTLLAGVAMVGLALAGIPLTGGLSLAGMAIAGTLLTAASAGLFWHARQISLSGAMSALNRATRVPQ